MSIAESTYMTHIFRPTMRSDLFSQSPHVQWPMIDHGNDDIRIPLLFVKHVELIQKVELGS